ncbi:MAG TPA: hypothetical protein VFI13_06715 [Gemmatimonadales bacterium]|nr:hypothetical protein [Gemmatimonadales bacterium]
MRTALPLIACLALGCGHTEPLTTAPSSFDQPFAAGSPLQLTYSAGSDRTPQWSSDRGHIVYAFDRGPRLDSIAVGCVAELPAAGGSRGAEVCDGDPTLPTGTIVRPFWPARRSDSAMAYVRQYWRGVNRNPVQSDLVLQPGDPLQPQQRLFSIPYFSVPTATTHSGISHLQWLDHGHLIYLARVQLNASLVNFDSGIEIVIVSADSGLASLQVVPGTHYASSVARGATSDTIYYTLGGQSVVYRRILSTGTVDTVFDFGALGIARDVQVKAGRLTAIVGGDVSFHPDTIAQYGMLQDDRGGPIYAATLPNGTPVRLADTLYNYQHLALAPDGAHVITERGGDLWSITLP